MTVAAPSSPSARQPAASLRRSPGFRPGGLLRCLFLTLLVLLPLLGPALPARAISVNDLPPRPPAEHVLDGADLLSRASRGEIERQLDALGQDRVDARLVTVDRLDYGLDLDSLGRQLIRRWTAADAEGGTTRPPLLLLLIDGQTRTASVQASPPLERQLPVALLRSTARTTMAQPIRDGERYRQATVDALDRLTTVLQGGEDPGEPPEVTAPVVVSNVPSREETASSNALTWVLVLLGVGSVVPMVTWWVFSR